jgi:hypothetical protein
MDSSPRADILALLAAGDITAEEAAQQLRGGATPVPPIPPVPPAPPVAPAPAMPAAPPVPAIPPAAANRWLRIRVSDIATGQQRVNVNLPLSWVAVGLRIGSRYSPELDNLDLGEILSHLEAGTGGQIVDVEDLDDGQRVQIYVD